MLKDLDVHALQFAFHYCLGLTYKRRPWESWTTTQPPYLYNLISIQCPRSTRSLSVVTLARPPSTSSLKITDRFFRYASPCLWNRLPLSLCQPHYGTSSSISYSPIPSPITSCSFDSPLGSSITPLSFTPGLKCACFTSPSPVVSLLRDCLHWLLPRPFVPTYLFFIFSFYIFSFLCRVLD